MSYMQDNNIITFTKNIKLPNFGSLYGAKKVDLNENFMLLQIHARWKHEVWFQHEKTQVKSI